MDPLFERRQLSKKAHIPSKYIQKNIAASILAQLKMNYEGKCLVEGYIQKNSITIVNYSLGRVSYIKGGVDYDVVFQADICFPHIGQRLKAPVVLRSKIGIHAETPPIKVLIPRDIHLGNEEFESIKVNDDVEFEVVGSQFKQEDESIIIVGKLLSKVQAPVELPILSPNTIPLPQESVSTEEKKVVITTEEQPKKRRLKQKEPVTANELSLSFKEGTSEGTN